MRHKTREMQVVEVTTREVCDLCGVSLKHGVRGSMDESEVTIEAKIGDRDFEDADYRKVYWIDCCADCFLAKVRPAIEALGVEVRERGAHDDDRVPEPQPASENTLRTQADKDWEFIDGVTNPGARR